MPFDLTILGSNSAAPAHNRHQSAQLLQVENYYFLIDCGEGTQMQISRYRAKLNRINNIFISHLHGDHYLGLVGLISTMHLRQRETDLNIYGPAALAEIVTLQLKHAQTVLNYKINFHPLDHQRSLTILDNNLLTVSTIPLNHRIPCTGFLFREKPKRKKIDKAKVDQSFSVESIIKLKNGEDVLDENGKMKYKNSDYTFPAKKSRSYAYCSDTKYDPDLVKSIAKVDLLYHESTFLSDKEQRAAETYHSTAEQAALIARQAKVKQLVLGHYSIRYKDLQPLLDEAKAVFASTRLAIEGERISVPD